MRYNRNRRLGRHRSMLERYSNRPFSGMNRNPIAYPKAFRRRFNEAVIFDNIDFEAVAKRAVESLPTVEALDVTDTKINKENGEVEVIFETGSLPHFVGDLGYSVEFEQESDFIVSIEVSFGVDMNGHMMTKEIAAFVYDMQTDTLEEDSRVS